MASFENFLKQRGAVTLLTALAVLIAISLVTLLSTKTVLVETQIAADNYRMSKAVAAANAALDFGVGYFNGSQYLSGKCAASLTSVAGFDHDNNNVVDTIPSECLQYSDGSYATLVFDNTDDDGVDGGNDDNPCVPATATAASPEWKAGMITAHGYSDDNLGQRIISQCVGTIDVFGGKAPKEPLISHGGVGLSGNFTVINRFNNTTVWSGSPMETGGSADTYILPVDQNSKNLSKDDLQNPDSTVYTQSVSDKAKGLGVDIIDNDPRLSALNADDFFNNFFAYDRETLYNDALKNGQVYSSFPSDTKAQGIVWVGPKPGDPIGDFKVTGGTYGTRDTNATLIDANTVKGHPVIMIVNGNLDFTAKFQVNGLLYVVGGTTGHGTPDIFGSLIVEDQGNAGKNGDVHIVYTPYTLEKASNPLSGLTTIISGTWRDW